MRTTKAQISLLRQYNTSSCYIQNFKTPASLCLWAGWFDSYLVENPEDRFSRDMAHFIFYSCLVILPGYKLSNTVIFPEKCYKMMQPGALESLISVAFSPRCTFRISRIICNVKKNVTVIMGWWVRQKLGEPGNFLIILFIKQHSLEVGNHPSLGNQDLHCLPFCLHVLDTLLYWAMSWDYGTFRPL